MTLLQEVRTDGRVAGGLALIGLGFLLLMAQILSWDRAWPIALIAVGGLLLWRSANPTMVARMVEAGPWISDLAVLGGIERRLRVPDFRGGSVTAVLGSIDLDLQETRPGDDSVVLDVVALLGAVEIRVPTDWRVEMQVSSGLGDAEDDTVHRPEPVGGPRLLVRGHAILGSVSVSN